jgi:hypothetical protein
MVHTLFFITKLSTLQYLRPYPVPAPHHTTLCGSTPMQRPATHFLLRPLQTRYLPDLQQKQSPATFRTKSSKLESKSIQNNRR